MGAFFAFMLVGVSSLFASATERRKKHYNALVAIEYSCNEQLDVVGSNIETIEGLVKLIESACKDHIVPLISSRAHHLIRVESVVEHLSDIDLMNRIVTYNVDVRRINADLDMLEHGYNTIIDLKAKGLITPENFFQMLEGLSTGYKNINKYLEYFEHQTIECVAVAQLQAQADKSLRIKAVAWLSRSKKDAAEKPKLEAQITKIQTDRHLVGETHRNALDKIYGPSDGGRK